MTVYPSFTPPLPMLAKMGTELVTVTGTAGDVWTLDAPVAQNHHADGYLTEVTIRVVLNGSVTVADQTGVAQHLKTREAEPEGELEATWDIFTRTPALYTPDMDALPTRFTLYSNETGAFLPFFGGFIGRVSDSLHRNGFHQLEITGRGAYITLSWQPITVSKTWPATTAEHTMIEEALALYAPYVSPSHEHILDGGLQIGEQMEGIQKTVRQLLDYVRSRGDSTGRALDWLVRTDPDGAFKLWLILRAREPFIDIPITSLKAPTTFVRDYEHTKTMVTVKWRDGYVDGVPLVPSRGAVRGIVRDYSSQIDNEPLARQVANMLLQNMATLDAISDGQIVVEYPKPIYKNGVPFPPHLVKSGWLARITGWAGGFTLAPMPIKSLEAGHVPHQLSLSLGNILEDDLQIGEQYFGKQTTILGTAPSGLIPLAIAPPEGVPQAVSTNAIGIGANGNLGWVKLGPDSDMEQWTYNIDGQGAVIEPGRKPPDPMQINGRIIGFRLTGNDAADPPGPGSIQIEVYHALAADVESGAIGTLATTIEIAAARTGTKNLVEPPAGSDEIFNVIAGDALIYKVLDTPPPDALTYVGITPLLQRTGGSGKPVASGAPTILAQTATRDATSGVVTFSVVTDRPCTVQIEYGETTNYKSKSQPSEIIKTTTHIPVILQSPTHWRVVATDDAKHVTTGEDQSF